MLPFFLLHEKSKTLLPLFLQKVKQNKLRTVPSGKGEVETPVTARSAAPPPPLPLLPPPPLHPPPSPPPPRVGDTARFVRVPFGPLAPLRSPRPARLQTGAPFP